MQVAAYNSCSNETPNVSVAVLLLHCCMHHYNIDNTKYNILDSTEKLYDAATYHSSMYALSGDC